MKKYITTCILLISFILIGNNPVNAETALSIVSNASSNASIQFIEQDGLNDTNHDTNNDTNNFEQTGNLPTYNLPTTGELITSWIFISGLIILFSILIYIIHKQKKINRRRTNHE